MISGSRRPIFSLTRTGLYVRPPQRIKPAFISYPQGRGQVTLARERNGTARVSRKTEKPTRELLEGTLPPQNLEAERAILGSILRDNMCLTEIVNQLGVDHFYADAHQKVFKTMLEMFEEAKAIDALTLGEALASKGWLKEIGGAPWIANLFDETFTAANVHQYVKIVQEKAVLRNLIHASIEILRDAYESTGPAEELLAEAEKRIFKILERRVNTDAQDLRTVLGRVFDRISDRKRNDGHGVGGVPTGFFDLDEMTNGWQESELIILAARPSMGKTALALNMTEAAAVDHGRPVLFVSLEMSELELAERLLCARSGVNSHLLRKGRLNSEDMQKLIHAGEELSGAPLYIDDTPGQTMLRISATARRLKMRVGLGMIVIDYLQLIEADDKSVSRQEQISTISRRLKNLSRELQVPVIALSQLNRAAENREGHRPRTSDLRESGSIEQDADVVLLLHRPDFYDAQDSPGEAELIIAKQRNGPVGDVKLVFQKESTRFRDYHAEMSPFSDAADGF